MDFWTDEKWSQLRFDTEAAREALESQGFPVGGFTNGKPRFETEPNWYDVQLVIARVISGEPVTKPPSINDTAGQQRTTKPAKGRKGK